MPEIPNSNPFASPAEAIVEEYSAAAPGKERIIRWAGLSTLSGALLYATYLTPATALFYLILVFAYSPEPIHALTVQFVPIAVACLATTVYGLIVGGVIGLAHGITGFVCRWKNAQLGRLSVLGVLAGLLVAIVPLTLYIIPRGGIHWESLTWLAILFVGAAFAGWRLNVNIHRYLLVPLWDEVAEAET